MKELLTFTLAALDRGERVVWCVILSSQGSTPRGPGAKMAVPERGEPWGTVGGGSVELQALQLARTRFDGPPLVRTYDLISGGSEATGMICGGTVQLAFLSWSPRDRARLAALLQPLGEEGPRWLELRLEGDRAHLALMEEGDLLHGDGARLPQSPTLFETPAGLRYVEPLDRGCQVWLFGGGHVGRALVPVLLPLGFAVTVYDPRPELAREERYPGAQVLLGDYETISQTVTVSARDYVVVMTPEHRMDLTVLRQVLRTPAAYIGCIGSRRKTAYVNQALREEGFSQEDVARIHAPIGLPIRAKTPEEIAVSIAAEMILHRAGGKE